MSTLHREYKDYDEYVSHQKRKLKIGIKKDIKKFRASSFDRVVKSFVTRVKKFEKYIEGQDILCLGARLGHEVKAFRDLGFEKTIGIDLNPGENNCYVVKGDFHNTGFADKSFDTIYTNSIDHAWDFKLLFEEMDRILRPNGVVVLEVDHLVKKNDKKRREWIKKESKYESLMFDNIKDIKKQLSGFEIVKSFESAHASEIVIVIKKK